MFRLFSKSLKIRNQTIRNAGTFGNLKVAICGAAGQSGQTVALLLKACPLIDELALYDIASTGGIAMELNHIDTKCKVYAYKRDLKGALENSQIVTILASGPRLKGVENSFNTNAEIVCELTNSFGQYCPKAMLVIATSPVNSLVPLASEVLKHNGVYNQNHIFGVTTLDVMRTNSLVAQKIGIDPELVHVPCIGGCGRVTAVPVLSQTKPKTFFCDEELLSITEAVQTSASKLQEAGCSNTFLSGSLGIAQLVISLARGIKGEPNVVETCYVRSKAYPNMDYLSTPIVLGTDGVQKILGVPNMTNYEKCLFQTCRESLKEEIQQGEDYIKSKYNQICS